MTLTSKVNVIARVAQYNFAFISIIHETTLTQFDIVMASRPAKKTYYHLTLTMYVNVTIFNNLNYYATNFYQAFIKIMVLWQQQKCLIS